MSFSSDTLSGYRYGFNNQEKDDEIAGDGNSYTAEYWQYDSRLGRRFNSDPRSNPSMSVYLCFNNNPIAFTDVKGDTTYRFNTQGVYIGVFDLDKVGIIGQIGEFEEKTVNEVKSMEWVSSKSIKFNDYYNADKYQLIEDNVGKQLIHFVSKANVNWIMNQSGIKRMGDVAGALYAKKESECGKMDFNSAYTLPSQGIDVNCSESVIPYDTKGGFMLFEDDNTMLNLNDAGQFLWGFAMKQLGVGLKITLKGASWYNPDDSEADTRAIKSGYKYTTSLSNGLDQGFFLTPNWDIHKQKKEEKKAEKIKEDADRVEQNDNAPPPVP